MAGTREQTQRRGFIRTCLAAVGGAGALAIQGRLGLVRAALAAGGGYAFDDYRSLVCVYLDGGNDAFNMFVPYASSAYAEYAGIRRGLAIPRPELLPVRDGSHAFHPAMSGLRDLYDAGRLGVVSNTGVLFEPLTRAQVRSGNVPLPPDLFSHSHQKTIWQTTRPAATGVRLAGWGGRMADLLRDANADNGIPPTFSLSGLNAWQAGDRVQPLSVRPWAGIPKFDLYNENWSADRIASWERILALPRSHPMERQYAGMTAAVRGRLDVLREAYAQSVDPATPFDSGNDLANQLYAVARLISIRELLGMKRQIFYVSLGGWDTHGNQLADHASRLRELDSALASFYRATVELGVADSTLTFTASEFGRTLTSNGDGTDHAWGAHQLVLGDAVRGGRVTGELPSLALGGPDDAGVDGRIIPRYALDQYGATLARWMGLDSGDILEIFPHLRNFDTLDLGFLAVADRDRDGVSDDVDKCPDTPDANQADLDRDGVGDACDADDDNDGLPDAWETGVGLDPRNPADAALDGDGDGLDNLAEYRAGTDPRVVNPDVARRRMLRVAIDLLLQVE